MKKGLLARNNNPNVHKVTIASDNQGRGLATYLEQASNGNLKTFNYCHPGAPIEPIMKSITNSETLKELTKKDCVIILGGTINFTSRNTSNSNQSPTLYNAYLEKHMDEFKHAVYNTIQV